MSVSFCYYLIPILYSTVVQKSNYLLIYFYDMVNTVGILQYNPIQLQKSDQSDLTK